MENLDKKQIIIAGIIGMLMLLVIGIYIYTKTNIKDNNYEQFNIIGEDETTQIKKNVENTSEEIVIHIAGAVNNPGIVRIKEGARIADIIEKAGGTTVQADITNINLAYIVEDGQKITIPKTTDENKENIEYITESSGQINEESINTKKVININKATKEELQNLDGVGESTANKIIEYRKEHGNFKQIEDIKNVPGIGEAKFDGIKNSISIK